MMSSNRNENRNVVTNRLGVLATVIGEYAAAFGADQTCLETIRKGIFQRQIVKEIRMNYYSGNQYVGRVIMRIDWEKHQVLVKSEGGNEFRLDTGKSILEQLDKSTQELIKHVQRMKKACHVTRITYNYPYRPEWTETPKKYKEALDFLGHVPGNKIQGKQTAEFSSYVSLIIDKLEELEVTVES